MSQGYDRQYARYQALLRAARNLFQLTDLNDVIEHVLKHSLSIMEVEACSMYLPDRMTKELVIYSARGSEDVNFHAARIPWDAGIAGQVFQQKTMIRVDDVQNDPRFLRDMDKKSGFISRAMLCFPLNEKDDCLGVLQAINPICGVFSDEDQDLLWALSSIMASALLRLEREKKLMAEAKLNRELSLAHEIQKSFLPPEKVILPRAELHVRYQPARTIGGDFYAAIPLENDRFLVAIGDVSGKGIPAALTTAQVTGEINALSIFAKGDLREWVRMLNHGLCGRLAAGRFVATTFLLYDPHAGKMEVACAGQFAPWRWDGQRWAAVDVPSALPLGILSEYEYESRVFDCQPGEKWLLFSDGINEGRNNLKEEYGLERLQESLTEGDPEAVLETAWKKWHDFTVCHDLHDDACLALVACRPAENLVLTSEASCCKLGRRFVEGWGMHAGFSDLERGQMVLAVDEAFTNVIRHAYGSKPGQKIEFNAGIQDGKLILKIRDYGPPIDPSLLKGRDLKDIKPGGLGLPLLHMIFPEVEFQALPDGTELRLAKPVPANSMSRS